MTTAPEPMGDELLERSRELFAEASENPDLVRAFAMVMWAGNHGPALLARLDAAEARVKRIDDYAFEATKAITGLVGGGSEMFAGKIGDRYIADLSYCVERLRDRLHTANRRAMDETKRSKAAEAENERLRLLILGGEDAPGLAASLTFDEVRKAHEDSQAFARAVAETAEANARRMREALEAIDALGVMEINPSNYDHEIVCELNANAVQAASIARAALKEGV